MPDLRIHVDTPKVVPFAAVPTLVFPLQIENRAAGEEIHTINLRCQTQIEVTRRSYAPLEQERLGDLFGSPARWSQTLRNLLWIHTSVIVPKFAGAATAAEMPVPCTFDFNVAATKYFDAVRGGEIPLLMLFSGTVFYATSENGLQVAPISWELEAQCILPAATWTDMMSLYYPNSVWINLHRDVFDRLHQYKIDHGIPTWEKALEQLLQTEDMVRQ
jgi:hypothetical protein